MPLGKQSLAHTQEYGAGCHRDVWTYRKAKRMQDFQACTSHLALSLLTYYQRMICTMSNDRIWPALNWLDEKEVL